MKLARRNRQIFLTIALAGALGISMPADAVAQRWAFGVRGGATIARLSGDGDPWPYRTGYSVGGALIAPLAEKLSFQFEADLIQKGMAAPGSSDRFAATLTYLEFPFLARSDLAAVLSGPVRPVAYLGPVVAVLLSCRFVEGTDPAVPCSANEAAGLQGPDRFGETTTVDLGILGGLGVETDISPTLRMVMDARFEHGVFSVDQNYDAERNQAWSFAVTFLYVLGG